MSAKTIAFAPRRKGGDAPLVINADTLYPNEAQLRRGTSDERRGFYLAHHHGGAGAALGR